MPVASKSRSTARKRTIFAAITAAGAVAGTAIATPVAHAEPVVASGSPLSVQQTPAYSLSQTMGAWGSINDAGPTLFNLPELTTLTLQARTGDSAGTTVLSVHANPKNCVNGAAGDIELGVDFRNTRSGTTGQLRLVPCTQAQRASSSGGAAWWSSIPTDALAATGSGPVTFTTRVVFHKNNGMRPGTFGSTSLFQTNGHGSFTAR